MDAERLWESVKEIVSQMDTGEDGHYSFRDVVAVSFSETTRLLRLQAKDTSQTIYLNTRWADPLIKALENLVGQPAFIECAYVSKVPKSNPRFSVCRTDDNSITDEANQEKPKSALQLMLEDISDLKRRVAELEKQSKKN